MAGTRSRNCPSASNSRFTAIRSARNVFVAGCSFCLPLEVRAPATTVARCSVPRIGRARTMLLAILLESRSSPTGRAGRRALSRPPCSRCPPPLVRLRESMRMSSGPASAEGKSALARYPAACSKRPGPPARHRREEVPAPRKPRRFLKSSRAPKSPCLSNSFSRSRAISRACASRSIPINLPVAQPPRNFQRVAPKSHRRIHVHPRA